MLTSFPVPLRAAGSPLITHVFPVLTDIFILIGHPRFRNKKGLEIDYPSQRKSLLQQGLWTILGTAIFVIRETLAAGLTVANLCRSVVCHAHFCQRCFNRKWLPANDLIPRRRLCEKKHVVWASCRLTTFGRWDRLPDLKRWLRFTKVKGSQLETRTGETRRCFRKSTI